MPPWMIDCSTTGYEQEAQVMNPFVPLMYGNESSATMEMRKIMA